MAKTETIMEKTAEVSTDAKKEKDLLLQRIAELEKAVGVHVQHLQYKNAQLLEMENRIFNLQAAIAEKAKA